MIDETNNSYQQKDIFAAYANESRRIEIEGYERAIRKIKNALFRAGGLYLGWQIVVTFSTTAESAMPWVIVAFAGAAISAILGFWAKTKPYTAVAGALIFFTGLTFISAVFFSMRQESATVQRVHFTGLIINIILIVSLMLQLKDAKTLQKVKKI